MQIIEKLNKIARENQKELYIKQGVSLKDNILDFIFFCPVTGKTKYLKIELDKFCEEQLSHISVLLQESITPKYVDYIHDRPLPNRLPPIEDEVVNYCKSDVQATLNAYYGMRRKLQIEKVIFNDPATIIFWTDGTKTVVKAQDGEVFDPEKGMAMAISKKFLGNHGNYFEEFKKWVDVYHEVPQNVTYTDSPVDKSMTHLDKLFEEYEKAHSKFSEAIAKFHI